MKQIAKSLIPYLVAIVTFIIISVAFSYPGVFENKSLYQTDMVAGQGIGEETLKFEIETGEKSLWTNSLFGGMPTYQIRTSYPSTTALFYMNKVAGLYLPAPANFMFALMFGAFLLFMSFGYKQELKNTWKAVVLAMLGAIAYAFSSYFIIIIQAGHIWKVYALCYIPPTLAGVIWAYRGKYWVGGLITAIYGALQLYANHPQMSFYFVMFLIIFLIAELIHSIRAKLLSNFFKATGILAVAACLAIGANSTHLYHSLDYTKFTIRGPSELMKTGDQTVRTAGIDRDYATSWSYGIGETFTLLVPNAKGGATDAIGNNRDAMRKAPQNFKQDIANYNHYWGNQPFTSGPVYVGAFIMFLFVFGLFIVKGRWKWILLIATLLSIMLSWGSNFMWFSNLFFDFFPGYNKFRAVSSILIIAELTIPMLAIMTLFQIIKNPAVFKTNKNEFYISLGLTAGLILLLIIYPNFFSFFSKGELDMFAQAMQDPKNLTIYREFMNALESVRISIFRADAWRSLIFILIGVTVLLIYSKKKINTVTMFVLLPVLVLVDLFAHKKYFNKGHFKPNQKIDTVTMLVLLSVLVLVDLFALDKRYLNKGHFKPKQKIENVIAKTPADIEILKDKDLNFRVFNLSLSPFQDGTTSFYHKSIGGYHGAKLRRYQELIEHHISKRNEDVLNMLNTKYIIIPDNKKIPQAVVNHDALGNAWFVDTVKIVNSPDEELNALGNFNPSEVAFADKRLTDNIPPNVMITPKDSAAYIKLTSYAPNKLTYEAQVSQDKFAVLSEIYYPNGWHAYIDGKEVPIVRVNYVLRALTIPEGKHNIELVFDPKSYHVTENMANISYIIMLLFMLLSLFMEWKQCKPKQIKEENEG